MRGPAAAQGLPAELLSARPPLDQTPLSLSLSLSLSLAQAPLPWM